MNQVAFGGLVKGGRVGAGGAGGGGGIPGGDGREGLFAERLHAGFVRAIALGTDFSLTDALEGGFRVGHGIRGECA